MDPIHPIVPKPPSIPPVTPAPLVGRVDREGGRRGPEDERRRGPAPRDRRPESEDELGAPGDRWDDSDRPHIDITA
jgi:hypothetical protein